MLSKFLQDRKQHFKIITHYDVLLMSYGCYSNVTRYPD